jgi:AraC-like DNA-binding protein
MSIIYEERLADAPLAKTIAYVRAENDTLAKLPADGHLYLYVMRHMGKTSVGLGGPKTQAVLIPNKAGTEWLGIRFNLGTFMPHLPVGGLVDNEITLPQASSKSFWLNGAAWQFPDQENADTFVERLVHEGLLQREPLVDEILDGQSPDLSLRSIQRRFARATGLTLSYIRQIERARQAASLLQQGVPILDTVYEAGYFDQAHLTRSLKRLMGQTPAQLLPTHPFK